MPAPKMHDDEIAIDADLVRSLLTKQHRELAGLPLTEVRSTGTVNALFRLGPELVVRLPRTPRWHDLDREVAALRALGPQLPVHVPEVVDVGVPEEEYPFAWGIFRWIEGQPWRAEDLDDPHAAALEVVAFMQALQAIDPESLPCGLPPRLSSLGHRDEGVRVATAAAAKRGLIDDAGALLAAWEAALAVPKWQGRRPLLHSDLLAGNLLVRDGRLVAVIDWSSLAVGDPARELMATWNLFATDDRARAAFRDALPYDDDTWARASGWSLTRIVNVAYYERSNPEFSADARRVIAAVLRDLAA